MRIGFVMGALIWSADTFTGLTPTHERIIGYVAALAGALLVGAMILALVDRWRKRQMNETKNVQDEIASYKELYQRGELSADEYQRVRGRLVDRLKARPKPVIALDPETGKPIEGKNPTAPVVPKAPEAPKEPETPPPPPPEPPTS